MRLRAGVFKFILSISVILSALVASPAIANQKILVFGDSLSAAYGLDEKSGWVYLLQQKLDRLGYDAKVINASISGETTTGGANKIKKTLELHQPDIVIIELGGNDGLQGLSLQRMRQNLTQILKAAKQYQVKPLLIGMKIPPNYGIKYTKQFSETYTTLSNKHQTAYVPFLLEGIGGNPLLMQQDGIHANASAQPKILDNVWPTLLPLLTIKK
ncbi:MAG: arylesterase [Methylophilaceae bacterium]